MINDANVTQDENGLDNIESFWDSARAGERRSDSVMRQILLYIQTYFHDK